MKFKKDVGALLTRWDRDEEIEAISMGGLGAAYERAIYATAFCMMRELLRRVDAGEDFDNVIAGGGDALWRATTADPDHDGGITGAMFGAACNILGMFVHNGHQGALERARQAGIEDCRFITISRGSVRLQ